MDKADHSFSYNFKPEYEYFQGEYLMVKTFDIFYVQN
jgi:hypothetical protein